MGALAVARTSAPKACASWIAAKPTPPAPAWISTRSPRFRPAPAKASCAVTKAEGRLASAAAEWPAGAGNHQLRAGHRLARQRAIGKAQHLLAQRQPRHVGPDLQHAPTEVAAETLHRLRVEADRDQHVAEVQPHRSDSHPDLAGPSGRSAIVSAL